MKPFSPRQFYGAETPHFCPNHSLQLVADTIAALIFKSLNFPIRDKPKKVIRVKILRKDIKYISGKTVDQLLRLYSSTYEKSWGEKVISAHGDKNVINSSSVKVRKARCVSSYRLESDGKYVSRKQDQGYEVVVTVIRERRPGTADLTQG